MQKTPVSSQSVLFAGSRSLPDPALPVVASIVAAAAGAWSGHFRVGCAQGADAAALAALLRLGLAGRVSVFSVAPQSRSVSGVAAAAGAGAFVQWSAGGVAPVPVRARFAIRARAAAAGAAFGFFFFSSPGSRGSLLASAAVAGGGGQVFAFCFGFAGPPSPLPGQPGAWAPWFFAGQPCFRWVSAQPFLVPGGW